LSRWWVAGHCWRPKRGRQGMREWFLILTLVVGLTAVGCSGGGDDKAGRGDRGKAENGVAESTKPLIGSNLGHQAFQPSTRLVVPDGVGTPFDRAGRVLAGLAEGTLGVRMFVNQRPGEEGFVAWRDVAAEEPEGHQLAYVTEGLLAPPEGTESGGIGPGDFEMVALTDRGFAVLVAIGDPEIETLQGEDFETFGDFVEGAREDPGLVEVADAGQGTVYRAGAQRLELDLDVDLSLKSFANKSPVEAIYNGDVETALVPLDWNVYSDVLAGELTALAVLSEERAPDLPDVPTTKELGHDVTVPVFGGVAAPAGTPPDVVDELGRAFVGASSSRTFRRALVGTGREPEQKGPEKFEAFVEKLAKLLRKTESAEER
jgi:tripartite-type tricarboxylate transporter receptor subunit TctC